MKDGVVGRMMEAAVRRTGIEHVMRIAALVRDLPVSVTTGDAELDILDITEDSRTVIPGAMFIARCGLVQDGRRYIHDAIARGAAAILSNAPAIELPESVAMLVSSDVPTTSAVMAERLCGRPTSSLELVGITGTNGKTTTAYLLRHLLNRAGRRCGLIGTVAIDDGSGERVSELTTPPAIELSRIFQRMVSHGCDSAVMEVSSHALCQGRVAGLHFEGAVFTNLSGDHLDYHGSMEAYADAKAQLFSLLGPDAFAVVNNEDVMSGRMVRDCRARVIRTSIAGGGEAQAVIRGLTAEGASLVLEGPWGSFAVHLPIIGAHNVSNALQAVVAAHMVGLGALSLRDGLSSVTAPPGRLESVSRPEDPCSVLVDYAHTDAALDNVCRAVRPLVPGGRRLIVVFGCGGDRDRTKRPRMASIACTFGDIVIVTSDNPRTEPPEEIIDEIMCGIPANTKAQVERESDRARAIHLAIELAGDGDIVLIAGKGHEDYQIIGRTKHSFDDRLVARTALDQRQGSVTTP